MNAGETLKAFAETFFTRVCPQLLRDREAAVRALGGSVAFRIRGSSEWLIDYADAQVRRGEGADAELDIELDASDFERLVRGRLDLDEAMAAGRLQLKGQQSLFGRVGLAFSPV